MEWFLYNRTAAYDGILEQAEKASRPASRSSSHHRLFRRFSRQGKEPSPWSRKSEYTTNLVSGEPFPLYPPSLVRTSIQLPGFLKKAWVWLKAQLPNLDPKELLPLGLSIRTGAIILGNPSTPNLLVVEFQNAAGTFGIVSVGFSLYFLFTSRCDYHYLPYASLDPSLTSISKSLISNFSKVLCDLFIMMTMQILWHR